MRIEILRRIEKAERALGTSNDLPEFIRIAYDPESNKFKVEKAMNEAGKAVKLPESPLNLIIPPKFNGNIWIDAMNYGDDLDNTGALAVMGERELRQIRRKNRGKSFRIADIGIDDKGINVSVAFVE